MIPHDTLLWAQAIFAQYQSTDNGLSVHSAAPMMVNAALLLHGNRAMEEFRPYEKRRQNATICVTLIASGVAGQFKLWLKDSHSSNWA